MNYYIDTKEFQKEISGIKKSVISKCSLISDIKYSLNICEHTKDIISSNIHLYMPNNVTIISDSDLKYKEYIGINKNEPIIYLFSGIINLERVGNITLIKDALVNIDNIGREMYKKTR